MSDKLKKEIDDAIQQEKRDIRLADRFNHRISKTLAGLLETQLGKILGTIVAEIKNIKIVNEVNVPEVKMPEMPRPKVVVNVDKPDPIVIPPIKVPEAKVMVKMPKIPAAKVNIATKALTNEMRAIKKAVEAQGMFEPARDIFEDVSFSKPVPVIQVDASGKPVKQIMSGGGGSRPQDYERSTTGAHGAVNVATTATQVVPEILERKAITVTQESDDPVYFGFDDTVTTANGFPVVANQVYGFGDYTGKIYAVISSGAASSTISVRYHDV